MDSTGEIPFLRAFEVVFQRVEINRRLQRAQHHQDQERPGDEREGEGRWPPVVVSGDRTALASVAARGGDFPADPTRSQQAQPDAEGPRVEPAEPADSERDRAETGQAEAEGEGEAFGPAQSRREPQGPDCQQAQADARRRDQKARQDERQALGEVLDVAELVQGRAEPGVVPAGAGDKEGDALGQQDPAPDRRDLDLAARQGRLRVARVRQGGDEIPRQPGQLGQCQAGEPGPAERPGRSAQAQRVGPIVQGANSSSPTPCRSLFVFLPPATSRINSNRRRPTAATGSPSRTVPASRSMSSIIR